MSGTVAVVSGASGEVRDEIQYVTPPERTVTFPAVVHAVAFDAVVHARTYLATARTITYPATPRTVAYSAETRELEVV